MASDHEPPTRRLDPQQPGTHVRETEYAAGPTPQETELRDKLRSLQTALALVGVLAAAALGVALWTLLSEDEEGDGRGASPQRVDRLQDRVEKLEDRVGDRATKSSVDSLRDDLEAVQEDAAAAAEPDESGAEAQAAVEELQGEVEALEQQVADLAQQGADGGQEQP